MCSNLATSTRRSQDRNSKPRGVTVTATDYEFQRAVLCCLAAGWSQSPNSDAVTRHGQHRPCASVHVQSRLMQAQHASNISAWLLGVRIL
jgi:hypothetical protein